MFDISFTQLLVVVTVSGYILGRKDMKNLAKLVGGGVGKFVGSLQGMRVKYEQKSQNQNVELKTLHTSVRSGLRDLSTVGYDLLSVSPLRMASSPLMSQHYNSHSNPFSPNIPAYNPNVNSGGMNGFADTQITINPILVTNPLDGSTSPVTMIDRNIGNIDIVTNSVSNVNLTERNEQTSAANNHYLRLIVAERELNSRLQQEAQQKNGGKVVPQSSESQPSGADILHSVVSDCIIAGTYHK